MKLPFDVVTAAESLPLSAVNTYRRNIFAYSVEAQSNYVEGISGF